MGGNTYFHGLMARSSSKKHSNVLLPSLGTEIEKSEPPFVIYAK